MKKGIKRVLLSALVFSSINGYAADKILEASRQVTINVNADIVWDLLCDFNGLNKWHPAVVSSKMHGKGSIKGDIRILALEDGGLIYDELIDYKYELKEYTYKVISAPLPVTGYVGRLKVISDEPNTSTIIWSSNFIANGASDEDAIQIINGIYAAGLDALSIHFK